MLRWQLEGLLGRALSCELFHKNPMEGKLYQKAIQKAVR